jgi:hypothetical protein
VVPRHSRRVGSDLEDAVSDSPHEYIEQLKRDNARLRGQVATLEDLVQRQIAYIKELRQKAGLAPHDAAPARPGVADID